MFEVQSASTGLVIGDPEEVAEKILWHSDVRLYIKIYISDG
jgi:hypothetical protein